MTLEEIDAQVSNVKGTWIKRRNARRSIINSENEKIDFIIKAIDLEIRRQKASTMKEDKISVLYSFKSNIERKRVY